MKIRSLTGDDEINSLAMGAMISTINQLRYEGLLSNAQADAFLDSSVCMVVAPDGGFESWVKRIVGIQPSNTMQVVVAKMPAKMEG